MMKRKIIAIALLAVMLTGCAGNSGGGENTPNPDENPPQNELEQTTDGKVEVFALENGLWDSVYLLEEDILLIHKGETTKLELLNGETLQSSLEVELHTDLRDSWLETNGDAVAYFDSETADVVFLNNVLREVSRLDLPNEMVGQPRLSPDWKAVYFCTSMGIYKMDLQTGLSHLIREQKNEWQTVAGVLFDGKMLRCDAKISAETQEVRFVDATTGESLWVGESLETLITGEELWYLPSQRSMATEHLLGRGETVRTLWPVEDAFQMFPVMEEKLGVTVVKSATGCRLDGYDFETGMRIASVELEDYASVVSLVAKDKQNLWFLAKNEEESSMALCRWNPDKNIVTENESYFKTYFTLENADTQGLESLQQAYKELGQTYGVEILLWDSAVSKAPDGNALTREFVTQAYEKAMPLLEKAMQQFPEGFLKTLATKSGSKTLKICLVREISDISEDIGCLQYWKDKEAYLVLEMGENLERRFYHGISYLIETRVLSVCTAYYNWDNLNPEGFTYQANPNPEDENYLEGEHKTFIHRLAMTSAREDRAFTMEYACMPENGEDFESAAMQVKLTSLCEGIREAFDLEKSEIIYPWEQHLNTGE